jgi:acetolactate synthase-1/2/3 large subunit
MSTTTDVPPAPDSVYFRRVSGLIVAQLVLEYLRIEGAHKLFGIPGSAIVYLKYELRNQAHDFEFVVCRHETGAAYMAHGYSIVTDGLGVVLTTAGPGATNALTGVVNGQASGGALLVITGEVAEQYLGRGYLQAGFDAELDIDGIYRSALKSSTNVTNPSNFITLFQQALRDARSVPSRVAHISLPADVAGQLVQSAGLVDATGESVVLIPNTAHRYRATPACTDPKKVRESLQVLTQSDRPLIFLGNGSRRALRNPERLAAFTHFIERFAIPVMTTPDAKGVFPETHTMSLRNYGMTSCRWPERYMHPVDGLGYDTLLVLGSSLGEFATSLAGTDTYSQKLLPTQHFIQVDLDQGVIARNFPITTGIIGDIGATLDALCRYSVGIKTPLAAAQRRSFVAAIKQDPQSAFFNSAWRESDAAPVNPAALMRVVNEVMTDGHVFIDAGNCVGWSLNNMIIDPPLQYHSALAMGPMGFAVAAVVGAKMGAPDKACIAIVGDGAFLMHGAEISTAARYAVGAVWVVLDDNDLSMSSQSMAVMFPPACRWVDYYSLGRPDLVKFAEGLGAKATRISSDQGPSVFREQLRAALERAGKDGTPQVIAVQIDTNVSPPYGWPPLSTLLPKP